MYSRDNHFRTKLKNEYDLLPSDRMAEFRFPFFYTRKIKYRTLFPFFNFVGKAQKPSRINNLACRNELEQSVRSLTFFMYCFKNECESFIRFRNARKIATTRPQAVWIYCFRAFGYLKHEFLKLLLQQIKLEHFYIN